MKVRKKYLITLGFMIKATILVCIGKITPMIWFYSQATGLGLMTIGFCWKKLVEIIKAWKS